MNRLMKAAISLGVCLLMMLPFRGFAQEEPGINEYIFVEKEPAPINLKEIRETIGFPPAASELGLEGSVIARVLVSDKGEYVKHKFIGKADTVLRSAVAEHIGGLKFEPALSEGKPVTFWVNVPFVFRLLTEEDLVEKAITLLNEEVQKDTTNFMTYLKRGLQLKELRRVNAAISDFDNCIKWYENKYADLAEDDTTQAPSEFKYYALYARGLSHAMVGSYESASEDLSSAIQWASTAEIADSLVAPTLPNAYLERGYMHFQLEEDDEAMADYNWVIDNVPAQACRAHGLITELRLMQEDKPKIVEAYGKMIECNPDNESLYFSRGFYKGELGMVEEAIADLQVPAEKSLSSKVRVASHNRMAWILFNAKEYDRALEAIQGAKDVNVLNPIAYYYEGLIKLAQEDKEGACEALAKSISYGLDGDELPEAEALVQVNCPQIEE